MDPVKDVENMKFDASYNEDDVCNIFVSRNF